MDQTKQKYYTVNQANDELPLIIPIVECIMANRQEMILIKKMIKSFKESGDYNKKDLDIQCRILKERSVKITKCLNALEILGCYLKDFEVGAVDFPSVFHGRVVFLSWQHGEVSVEYWHELTKGIDSRRKIA